MKQSKSFHVDHLCFDELPPNAQKHFVSAENREVTRFITPRSIIERIGKNIYTHLCMVTWDNRKSNQQIYIDLPLAKAQDMSILYHNNNKGLKRNCLKNRQKSAS